jgi:hypothetical protein
LKEEQRLRVLKNGVMSEICGLKRDEETGEGRRLRNEEFCELGVGWTGRVTRTGESRSAYGGLVGKPEANRQLERPRSRWGIILKLIFKK